MTARRLYPLALFFAVTWPAWALLAGLAEPERLIEQSLLTIALGLAVMATPIRQRTLWIILLVTFPVAALWGVFAHEFGGPPHTGTLLALTHSNFAESNEWLHSHALQSALIFLMAAGSLVMAVYAPRHPVFNRLQRKKLLASLLLFALTAIIQHDYWYGKRSSWALVTASDIEAIWPASPLWKTFDALWGHLPDTLASHPQFVNLERKQPLPVRKLLNEPLTMILVIGESHRTDTLNPLKRPDLTKELAKRLATNHLLWFNDVCAGATLTMYSVPALVTGAKPEESITKGRTYPSGLAYFKQAGFSTAWISNQDDGVFGEAGWDLGVFARRTSSHKPDEVLLPTLSRFLHSSTKTAIVVHLLGSHFDYVNRYPADAAVIPIDGLSGLALERAHYGNSEAYAANVLARIMSILDQEARPAVMLFTSDHGENLKDDERKLWRHGASKVVSALEIKVPTMLAWNSAYAASHPETLATLRKNADKPLTHANLFALWLRLGGLESTAAPSTESPDSISFIPPKQRHFRNTAKGNIESCEELR